MTKEVQRDRVDLRAYGRRKPTYLHFADPLLGAGIADLMGQDCYLVSGLRATFRKMPHVRLHPADLRVVRRHDICDPQEPSTLVKAWVVPYSPASRGSARFS